MRLRLLLLAVIVAVLGAIGWGALKLVRAAQSSAALELPALEHSAGFKRITGGDIGEFDFHVLFQQYASKREADEVAPAWRAAHFALFEDSASKRPLLQWAAEWDTPAQAKRAFGLYAQALEGKSKGLKQTLWSETRIEGTNQFGAFQLRVEGLRVTALEGLPY